MRCEGQVFLAIRILPRQHAECVVCLHHLQRIGIHDGGGKTIAECHGKEDAIDRIAVWQAEGDIRDSQGSMASQLPADAPQCLQSRQARLLVRGDSQRQGIEDNVLLANAVYGGSRQDLLGDFHTGIRRSGDALFIQGQRHNHAAVFLH